MSRIAFVFPGQGSQYIGMAKDFYDSFAVCRKVFESAQEAGGLDVKALCFEENENINITEYTQIAMLTAEIAMLRAVEEQGIYPDAAAGLSLGEYGALAAGKVMKEEDLFHVVRKRGIFMQEAVPSGGAMTAVLGLDAQVIEETCAGISGMVTVANYNCPGQTVITGEEQAVSEAAKNLVQAGAKRCVPLKVSGPFHSPLLEGAGQKLAEVLENVEIQNISIPYVANVTAEFVRDREQVRPLLVRQVASSVRWQQSVERMIAEGVDTFVEIGPGKTLTGFLRKISRGVTAINVEKVEDLEKLSVLRQN